MELQTTSPADLAELQEFPSSPFIVTQLLPGLLLRVVSFIPDLETLWALHATSRKFRYLTAPRLFREARLAFPDARTSGQAISPSLCAFAHTLAIKPIEPIRGNTNETDEVNNVLIYPRPQLKNFFDNCFCLKDLTIDYPLIHEQFVEIFKSVYRLTSLKITSKATMHLCANSYASFSKANWSCLEVFILEAYHSLPESVTERIEVILRESGEKLRHITLSNAYFPQSSNIAASLASCTNLCHLIMTDMKCVSLQCISTVLRKCQHLIVLEVSPLDLTNPADRTELVNAFLGSRCLLRTLVIGGWGTNFPIQLIGARVFGFIQQLTLEYSVVCTATIKWLERMPSLQNLTFRQCLFSVPDNFRGYLESVLTLNISWCILELTAVAVLLRTTPFLKVLSLISDGNGYTYTYTDTPFINIWNQPVGQNLTHLGYFQRRICNSLSPLLSLLSLDAIYDDFLNLYDGHVTSPPPILSITDIDARSTDFAQHIFGNAAFGDADEPNEMPQEAANNTSQLSEMIEDQIQVKLTSCVKDDLASGVEADAYDADVDDDDVAEKSRAKRVKRFHNWAEVKSRKGREKNKTDRKYKVMARPSLSKKRTRLFWPDFMQDTKSDSSSSDKTEKLASEIKEEHVRRKCKRMKIGKKENMNIEGKVHKRVKKRRLSSMKPLSSMRLACANNNSELNVARRVNPCKNGLSNRKMKLENINIVG